MPDESENISAQGGTSLFRGFKSDHKQKARSGNFGSLGRVRARAEFIVAQFCEFRGEAFCLLHRGGEEAGRFHGGSLIREKSPTL